MPGIFSNTYATLAMGAENYLTPEVMRDESRARNLWFRAEERGKAVPLPLILEKIIPTYGIPLENCLRSVYRNEQRRMNVNSYSKAMLSEMTVDQFIADSNAGRLDPWVRVAPSSVEQMDWLASACDAAVALRQVATGEEFGNAPAEWILSPDFDGTEINGSVSLLRLCHIVGPMNVRDAVDRVRARGANVTSRPEESYELLGEVDVSMLSPENVDEKVKIGPPGMRVEEWYHIIQFLMRPDVGRVGEAKELHREAREVTIINPGGGLLRVLSPLGSVKVDPDIVTILLSVLGEEITLGDFFDLGGSEIYPAVKLLEG